MSLPATASKLALVALVDTKVLFFGESRPWGSI
jgi:hypothetical protein